jgi:Arc/MetJ-type ribon-helix-helix transcriptional regulator
VTVVGYDAGMKVTLTPDQAAWLKAEIDNGHFASPADAIAYAIEQAKRALLQHSFDTAIERGGANSADDVRKAIARRLKRSRRAARLFRDKPGHDAESGLMLSEDAFGRRAIRDLE